jgi:orotate phosphoribosyltransferase
MKEKTSSVKKQIISILEKTGALKFGEFTLASGAKSNYYIDLRILPNFPGDFNQIVTFATEYIKENCWPIEGVVAIPLAGIPFGVMIAQKLGLPYYILRKEPKKHGLKKLLEGSLTKDQRILLIDDLISSGYSKVKAIEALRDEGGKVDNLFVFIDRSEGLSSFEEEHNIKVHYLINAEDILEESNE